MMVMEGRINDRMLSVLSVLAEEPGRAMMESEVAARSGCLPTVSLFRLLEMGLVRMWTIGPMWQITDEGVGSSTPAGTTR